VIIRCTEKLLALLPTSSRRSLAIVEPDDDDWYANLLRIARRKCVLVTHAGTLFSAFASGVGVAEIRSIHDLVIPLIERQLALEGLPSDTFGHLRSSPVTLAKTASRSILGCMNDMAEMCKAAVSHAGNLDAAVIDELNHQLQRTIFHARDYIPSIELAAAWRKRKH